MNNNIIKNILFFISGTYCGSYYDCKPYFKEAKKFIENNMPEER